MPTPPVSNHLKLAIYTGLGFGTVMGLFALWWTGSSRRAAEIAVFAGVGFGVAMQRFMVRAMSTTTLELDGKQAAFDAGETLLHDGPANHFKGMEAVGGKLFLTNRRLRFRSHKVNLQTHDESFPVSEIRSVELVNTLGLVPNGLLVHFADGTKQRFVVGDRKHWLAMMSELIGPRQREGDS